MGAAARAGDTAIRDAIGRIAAWLGVGIANMVTALHPDIVVLGGSVGGNEDLLAPVRRHLQEWMPFPPRLEVSALGEAAVLEGALAEAVDAALEHVFKRRARA